MESAWVYIVTNRPHGMLYIGATTDIAKRAWEHRTGAIAGFTKRYNLGRLVFTERFDDVVNAIQRERTMKHWSRAWKISLIEGVNPAWDDWYERLLV